jgi:hypothetical protein
LLLFFTEPLLNQTKERRSLVGSIFSSFCLLISLRRSPDRMHECTNARTSPHAHAHSNYVGALVASVAQLGSFKEQQRQSKGSHAKRRDDDVVRAHMYGPARVQSPFLHLSAADSYYMTAARTDYCNPFAIRRFS